MSTGLKHTSNIVQVDGEEFYRIDNLGTMDEFFMSLTSSGDHWFFVSSNGALTAGRGSPESALFPYGTVDKIFDSRGTTGPVTSISVSHKGSTRIWEPFATWTPMVWSVTRRLYRNALGSRVIFEEENHDLSLVWQGAWSCTHAYGFVRSCTLRNKAAAPQALSMVDGLLNLMHAGVTRQTQAELSCLTDAYKDSTLDQATGLAAFGLSALLTDQAKPMESLRASTVWSHGLKGAAISLSASSLESFRAGKGFNPVHRNMGQRGNYLVHLQTSLAAGASLTWDMVADINKDHRDVMGLRQTLVKESGKLGDLLKAGMDTIRAELRTMTGRSDAASVSAKTLHAWHHGSNVLYNIMRGGVPADGYKVDPADFLAYVHTHCPQLDTEARGILGSAGAMTIHGLHDALAKASPRLASLATEYLPLTFSRRHGDPSRPWNNFNIKVKDAAGKPILNHQGNWRDIFQNWEALAYSHPHFLKGFVANFLSAMTLDGYNPYRVGRDGIDWEKVEPDHPWSNIGYWNDHQVIYFQRLAELMEAFEPGSLAGALEARSYTYALVPYRIAAWDRMIRNPHDTIDFDAKLDHLIEKNCSTQGSDARLVHGSDGTIHHASLLEKILVLALAKTGNLVPGGGIWMNTQRPEWNDANNALVGYGLSMVTTAYLRRFMAFWRNLVAGSKVESFLLPAPLQALIAAQTSVMREHGVRAMSDNGARFGFVESMTRALDQWHGDLYRNNHPGASVSVGRSDILAWFDAAMPVIDATLAAAKRPDGLYDSYNIMIPDADKATMGVQRLQIMLEGQVAILSAHYLDAEGRISLMENLFTSDLYRADQNSFLLYPWKDLPDFFGKNRVDPGLVKGNAALEAILARQERAVLYTDAEGTIRFGAGLVNHETIDKVMASHSAADCKAIHGLYEAVFNHRAFMGRSGAMYAYEGLGSIYWHMVAKLLLAAMETRQDVELSQPNLLDRADKVYLAIRAGIGYQKSPEVYGAFPWEPYSHTPKGRGAQQPGMTGQVKEEVITRIGELGIVIQDGTIVARGRHVVEDEFLADDQVLVSEWQGAEVRTPVPAGALGFTFCQVPVIRFRSGKPGSVPRFTVLWHDGKSANYDGVLPREVAASIFAREGKVKTLTIV